MGAVALDATELLNEAEASGVRLRWDGAALKAMLEPGVDLSEMGPLFDRLRASGKDVAELVRRRASLPAMPPGVRLVSWEPKAPPVALEVCSIVTDVDLFVRTTLRDLGWALEHPRRHYVGWSVPTLCDRLAQVGVQVEVRQ